MAIPDKHREFLKNQRLVVVGLGRKAGPPHITPVYYAMDDNDVIISTTAARYKAKAVRHNPEVSLCVLGEQMPFPYLLIYGNATIEEGGAVETMMKIGERMTGNPVPESARPAIEKRAQEEGRLVLRVKIERSLGNV